MGLLLVQAMGTNLCCLAVEGLPLQVQMRLCFHSALWSFAERQSQSSLPLLLQMSLPTMMLERQYLLRCRPR